VIRGSRTGAAARLAPLVAILSLGSCTVPAAPRLPVGTIVSDAAILVAPGPRWETQARRWHFTLTATFAVYVNRPGAADLTVFLRPMTAAAGRTFQVSWDDQPLVEQLVIPSEGVEVTIPASLLTAGPHGLRLRRRYGADDDGNEHVNAFRQLGWRYGQTRQVLAPVRAAWYRALADFVLLGVTAPEGSREQRSGLLFDQPGSRSFAAESPGRGRLEMHAVNLSAEPATFSARLGETHRRVSVAPGASQAIELPVPAGRFELVLDTAGSADGLFLWGTPRFLVPRSTKQPPPIVLITLDTTRRDALAPYGGDDRLTPTLARFAREATVFDRAYTTAPWTLPAHASMFTGLYPGRHGAGVTSGRLVASFGTLAERLRDHGYATAGFAGGALSSASFGVAQGFSVYRDPDGFESRGDALTDAVLAHLPPAGHGAPPFLFVNYFDAHLEYKAPAAFGALAGVPQARAALAGEPFWSALAAGGGDGWYQLATRGEPPSPGGLAYLRAAYLAEVAFADAQLGRLFAALRQRGLYDEALIAVVADHGEMLGEHGAYSHAFRLDPELTEVPLLVKWPGQTAGDRSDALVSVADLFPTLLAAAGLEPPPSDGQPLPRAGQDAGRGRAYVLSEEHESIVHPRPVAGFGLAPHLLGVQSRAFRQVVWDRGASCSTGGPGAWSPAACVASWQQVVAGLGVPLVSDALAVRRPGADELSPEQRAQLTALGYL
jgi:arylsulfatase A-like enzyme